MKTRYLLRVAGLVLLVFLVFAPSGRGDGGFFWSIGTGADLSQTRQEAVLAIQEDNITYVIRTVYAGTINDFAWVLPVPDTPTNVVAHADNTLFTHLDSLTRPRFILDRGIPVSGGCGCAAGGFPGEIGQIVQVEASGKAGVYDWAALTSTGSSALLAWLTSNGYNVPSSAQTILDEYIRQGMHFLAVKVRQAESLSRTGGTGIPPLQFTVNTDRRLYPMVISQISAATQTEVLLYILGTRRAEGSNIPTGQVDPNQLVYNPSSSSLTNYESLFMQKIAELGNLALITEYAGRTSLYTSIWPEAPVGLPGRQLFLTRMRTLISRDRMTQDFEFRDAAVDNTFDLSNRYVKVPDPSATTAAVGQTLGAALIFSLFFRFRRGRLAHSKSGGGRASNSPPSDLTG